MIDLDTHLENLGNSSVQGDHGRWKLFVVRTRVSLGFTRPSRANGVDDSMPRSAISKLRYGAPMTWGTLWVLSSSKIAMPNPNEMWSLKNEIGYFRPQHHHLVAFNSSLIALMNSKLWPSKDRPRNALRAPWRLLGSGWPRMTDGLRGWNKGVTRVHPPTWS